MPSREAMKIAEKFNDDSDYPYSDLARDIDAAVIEALEEAAKAICSYCNNDKNELKTSGNCVWWHTLQPPRTTTPMCKAWCIHQLIAARKAAQGEGA